MASQLAGLIRDQNLNVHFNGTATGDKSTVSKASKKGVRGNRKPLGDLSNSVKPTPNHSLKKQNSNFLSDKEIGASISKITIDGAKRKRLSKAPEKLQTSSSRELSDISNSGKSHLHEAPKKNLQTKLRVIKFNGTSTGDKSTVSKASKKGVGGNRKPLVDGAKRKSLSKAREKLQTSSSRALSDCSNSGKSHLHEAPKKNLQTMLRVVAEDDLSADEGFGHNHEECIKAQNEYRDSAFASFLLEFIMEPAPPQLSKLEPASPPTCLDVEDLPRKLLEELSPW